MPSVSVVADILTGEKYQPDILEYTSDFCFNFFSAERIDPETPILCRTGWVCSTCYCCSGFTPE